MGGGGGGLGTLAGIGLGIATGGFGFGLGEMAGGALGGAIGGGITNGGWKGAIQGGLEGGITGGLGDIFNIGSTQAAAPVSDASFNAAGVTPTYSTAVQQAIGLAGSASPIATDTLTNLNASQVLNPSNPIFGPAGYTNAVNPAMATASGYTAPTGGMASLFGGGGSGASPLIGMGQLGQGVMSLLQGQQLQQQAQQLGQQVDPNAALRVSAGQQLAALQANPSNVQKLPGYQAGLQAVTRQQAAQGYQGSGNMMAALAGYGGQAYQNQVNTLQQQAGLNNIFAPGQAGQLQGMLNMQGMSGMYNGLGSIAQGVNNGGVGALQNLLGFGG